MVASSRDDNKKRKAAAMTNNSGASAPPIREINCGNCGVTLKVHEPLMVNLRNPSITQLSMIAYAGTEERTCLRCGAEHMPIFVKAEIGWVAIKKEDNQQQRIIPANAPAPLSKEQFEKIMKNAKKA